jgi:L-fucose isomerase-like protein
MSLKKTTGVEIEFFEMLEVVQTMETLDREEIDRVIKQVKKTWQFENEAAEETLINGVKLYLGVKAKVLERGYDAVSLIDVDGVKKLLKFTPAMAFMLLGEDPGVCTIPENDALGSVTQLLIRYLTGQPAPYFEFYEFMEDRVLMGVPDFVPSSVVDGKVTVSARAYSTFQR